MVSVRAQDAVHYGTTPAGPVPGGIGNADELVLMRFKIDPKKAWDPYGTGEHLVLDAGTNIRRQSGFTEVRVPAPASAYDGNTMELLVEMIQKK